MTEYPKAEYDGAVRPAAYGGRTHGVRRPLVMSMADGTAAKYNKKLGKAQTTPDGLRSASSARADRQRLRNGIIYAEPAGVKI